MQERIGPRSGDFRAGAELGAIPCASAQDGRERIGGSDHVGFVDVERREAEAHQIGRAEIADHAARYQGLHDRIALGMAEGDLRSAGRAVARAGKFKARFVRAAALDLGNEWISFNARFGKQSLDIGLPPDAVLGIFARENGKGMMFQEEQPDNDPTQPPSAPGKETTGSRPSLKIVK